MLGVAVAATLAAGPLWPTVCEANDATAKFPFCNQALSLDERTADLVGRLTLKEKQSILDNTAAAVPRLGLPAYQWWSEGLHGPLEPCVSDGGVTKCPTSFPAASAMAAALNDTLYLAAGHTTGVEGRAISNLREHNNKIGDGLTYWAPNANMERDPRWGRNQEAPGEDPHLTGQYIAHYVRGMQEGEDPDHVQMVATCKVSAGPMHAPGWRPLRVAMPTRVSSGALTPPPRAPSLPLGAALPRKLARALHHRWQGHHAP